MTRNQLVCLLIAFAFAFFAVGLSYWQIPYHKVALPNSIVNLGLIIPFCAATMVRFYSRVSLLYSVLVLGLAAPCAILLRVIVGVIADSTSHNLWPLEVILAGGVGFAVSLFGAVLGSGLLIVLGRSSAP